MKHRWLPVLWLSIVALSLGVFFNCGQDRPGDGKKDAASSDAGTSKPDKGKAPTDKGTTPDLGGTTPDKGNTQPDPGTTTPDPGTTTPDPGTTVPDPGTTVPDPGQPDLGQPDKNEPAPDRRKPPTGFRGVRFIAMGDTGTASSKQKSVAMAVKKKCDAEAQPGGRGPCQFGILLGDNFYDTGVTSAKDKQFKTKFSDMYHMLKFPWYITIGNHDYGAKGAGLEFQKIRYYLDYAKTDPYFVLPSSYFDFTKQNTHFISLNTSELFFGFKQSKQEKFVRSSLQKSKSSTWRIAFGHHPYISNGAHGNAGTYEGIPIPIPFVSGRIIKKFVEKDLCGKIDLYFSGHDHNRQILQMPSHCRTRFVVSGAGAKAKGFRKGSSKYKYIKPGGTASKDKSNPYPNDFDFQSDTIGFMFIYIDGRKLTIEALNAQAKVEYSATYTK